MGRLRNLSHSLKAAAFNSKDSNGVNGHASPSTTSRMRSNSPDGVVTKEVPTIAREASSTSVADSMSPSRTSRSHTRSASQIYNPPTIGTGKEDNIEELRPVFSFLSSHQNKLYQEGYFLKLNDLDIHGKPNTDRNWTECFAQLVGTVLSLWDAAALDAAGQDGEVAPSFINLADASIKMIETLPTRNPSVQPLQNVLSISTAGKNRYLFHFNSLHSLTQWTAGIRLAMFEHASLQELYTGSLIAGKGKTLNNIRTIMNKLKFVEEDWARVRFGAGTPWRRCWYVIEPPDEKEWQKAAKTMRKRGAYERPEYPRGDIKFYDTKKTKKATPIATISNVYSAYAVYPQSKPLIDQSTLVKLEGKITIHSQPESQTEGFVFVMPEVHPAVSGFEMMLRFLFPAFDTFCLYGRPTRLIADTLDARGLMFAMPKDRRYGYLDIIDVAGLIHTEGSDQWTEREWRKRMKELVSKRMTMAIPGRTSNIERAGRRSLGARPGIRYDDSSSTLSGGLSVNQSAEVIYETPKKTYTSPLAASSVPGYLGHSRSISEANHKTLAFRQRGMVPSRLSIDEEAQQRVDSPNISPLPPTAPTHGVPYKNGVGSEHEVQSSSNSSISDLEARVDTEQVTHDLMPEPTPPAPVNQPFFQFQQTDRPQRRPTDRPEMRREKSRLSNATLDQLADASRKGNDAGAAATAAWRYNSGLLGGSGSGLGSVAMNGRYDGQDRGVTSALPNELAESDANPLPKAIILDRRSDIPTEHSSRPDDRPAILRTLTQHSIPRKPLPFRRPTIVPTGSCPVPMYDRDSSPDYASTTKSEEKEPAPRKFGGVRKTVGDLNYASEKKDFVIPDFDFGITQSLTPGPSRPGTAAGRISPLESNSPLTPHTPNEGRKLHGDRLSPGRASPQASPSPQSRPASRQRWFSSSAAGRQSPSGLTPEEFVQQRAMMAQLPQYSPRRTTSSSKILDKPLPTPESSQVRRLHVRNSSRPSSRGSLLDFSSSLSAREQEHISRMTGTPLINLVNRSQTPDPNVGLIGAISAREQDKRNMKEGISSHLAQVAIAQRQQQAQSTFMHQVQAQYRPGANAWAPQQHDMYAPSGYYSQQQYYQPQTYQNIQAANQCQFPQARPYSYHSDYFGAPRQ